MNGAGIFVLLSLCLMCIFLRIGSLALCKLRHHLPDPQQQLLPGIPYVRKD